MSKNLQKAQCFENRYQKAWKTRRARLDRRNFVRLFAVAAIIASLIIYIQPTAAIAPYSDATPRLPMNDDKTTLTAVDALLIATRGYKYQSYVMRLAYCESRLNQYALNIQGNSAGIDRGILQINSYYHPEISDACAFDVACSARFAMSMIDAGRQHEWACDRIIRNN